MQAVSSLHYLKVEDGYLDPGPNVAITVTRSENKDSFEVGGRGELQLGVLIETMRREGFEMSVSRPRVLFKKDSNGILLEPMEEVIIDVDEGLAALFSVR